MKWAFIVTSFIISLNCHSQSSIYPDLVLFGSDEIPSDTLVIDTFIIHDLLKGGLSGGIRSLGAWARDSIGNASFAFGRNNIASGDNSVALGAAARARGSTSFALGLSVVARGNYGATSMGYSTTASGNWGSVAMGYRTYASGSRGAIGLGDGASASGYEGAIALGSNTRARGDHGATALGNSTEADGDLGATAVGYSSSAEGDRGAIALGYSTTASGSDGSIAMGRGSRVTGDNGSVAIGRSVTVLGDNGAIAMGYSTYVNGDYGAIALGYGSRASGRNGTTALGHLTVASGNDGSTALGSLTRASGDQGAIAMGYQTDANGNSCTVAGMWNDPIVSTGQSVYGESPLFIVGNGDSSTTLSNALVIRKSGEVSFENFTFPIQDGTNLQSLLTDGNGQLSWTDVDTEITNELQTLSLTGSILSISDKNSINLSTFLDNTDDWINTASDIHFEGGNVGIGSASVPSNLTIKQDGNGNDAGLQLIDTNTDTAWVIRTTGAQGKALRMVPVIGITQQGTARFFHRDGTMTTSSDRRLKKNMNPFHDQLKTILKVQPYTFNWINNKNNGSNSIGVVAQEIEKLYPSLVRIDEDGYKSVNYEAFGILAIQAIKEQQQSIEALDAKVNELFTLLNDRRAIEEKGNYQNHKHPGY